MFTVKFDTREFEERARAMGAALDQVPYALSRALNDAAKVARREIISDTWPSHVTVRNRGFLNAVMTTRFSDKHNLSVEFYDRTPDQRGHLQMHAVGGVKVPKGAYLPIPAKDNILGVTLGARGITPSSLKPAAVVSSTSKRALRIARIKRSGNMGIFVGRGGRLNLIYVLLRRATIKPTVPFYQDWADIIRREARLHFASRMKQAMLTRDASRYGG